MSLDRPSVKPKVYADDHRSREFVCLAVTGALRALGFEVSTLSLNSDQIRRLLRTYTFTGCEACCVSLVKKAKSRLRAVRGPTSWSPGHVIS